MEKKIFIAYFQKLSRAFLMPIALLSVASLMLGVSSIFLWHESLREMFPILTHSYCQYFANLLDAAAGVVMNNLPILYAVSIGFGMANEEKEYAAFGALTGYFAFIVGMGYLLKINTTLAENIPAKTITTTLGITTLNTGIIGAILVGIISAAIHNKVYKTQLPMAFAFFGGVRLVPIVTTIFFIIMGQIFPFIWTGLSNIINTIAYGVVNTGVMGPFLYQMGERLLIPTGLHQIWNTIIRDTAVSGIYDFPSPYGVIEGARGAFNAYMATNQLPPGVELKDMVKFLRGGQIPITVFALPAAAFAMYRHADTDKKNSVKGLLITGAFTSIIAGITEPLEFAFLFAAPGLFLIYALLNGLSYMAAYIFSSSVGGTEANVLGLTLFGFLRNDSNWWILCLLGLVFAGIFYFVFSWWIVKFDVKTPGRGGDYDNSLAFFDEEEKVNVADPKVLKAKLIIKGLGGASNIKSVDNCMSRLRVIIINKNLVNEDMLKATGCSGIVRPDNENIQIIYGTTVGIIKNAVKKEIESLKKSDDKNNIKFVTV